MTTLRKLLGNPTYATLTLLTDPELCDLDREIDAVEVTETPDVGNFISQNVLILTTGMYFQNQQEKLFAFIDSLIKVKSVGIGIKTSRFLKTVNPQVIAYANKKKFPIFNIPTHFSLGNILHQFLSIIWGMRNEETQFTLNIQASFSKLLVADADAQVMTKQLSKVIKSPVILADPFHELLTHAGNFVKPPIDYLRQFFDSDMVYSHSQNRTLKEDDHPIEAYIIPIFVYNFYPHYLIILNIDKVPFPISTFAIEQAALSLRFTIYKQSKLDESQQIIEANNIDKFLKVQQHGSLMPMAIHELETIATGKFFQIIKLDLEEQFNALVIERKLAEQMMLATEWLHHHMMHFIHDGYIFKNLTLTETYLLILEDQPDLNEALTQMAMAIQEILPIRLLYNLGNSVENWADIGKTYVQAQSVSKERKRSRQTDLLLTYQDEGAKRLLSGIDEKEKYHFCKDTLKGLAFPKDQYHEELRETLKAYLDCQCEFTKTANALFIHRNTVKYRIQRVEEMLGVEVNDTADSLNLRIALLLSEA